MRDLMLKVLSAGWATAEAVVMTLAAWKLTDWTLAAGLVVSLLMGAHVVTAQQAGELTAALNNLLASIGTVAASGILVVKILRHRDRQAADDAPPTLPFPGGPRGA